MANEAIRLGLEVVNRVVAMIPDHPRGDHNGRQAHGDDGKDTRDISSSSDDEYRREPADDRHRSHPHFEDRHGERHPRRTSTPHPTLRDQYLNQRAQSPDTGRHVHFRGSDIRHSPEHGSSHHRSGSHHAPRRHTTYHNYDREPSYRRSPDRNRAHSHSRLRDEMVRQGAYVAGAAVGGIIGSEVAPRRHRELGMAVGAAIGGIGAEMAQARRNRRHSEYEGRDRTRARERGEDQERAERHSSREWQ
ncbi:hypothetical protein EJ06DRAFT_546448 [Trichodelitschia bisporula]|uniref:Glycine zipper 2TM domain-containing protein n=1 Tax=Trichodelitschia bisporula TaxID=703511 RepID=A0A6G1I9E4_9PEZI|nr:hypothetical protein EJ06DRAFT_546448 [Trichodelitschia bisporula]